MGQNMSCCLCRTRLQLCPACVVLLQVIERVVEVEPDKAALVEQLRQQMKEEMEQHQQQLDGQALEAARQEAETRAKQQLEVRLLPCAASTTLGYSMQPCGAFRHGQVWNTGGWLSHQRHLVDGSPEGCHVWLC